MRILIAEDDVASRLFMKKFLSKYGECDVAVDGIEALDAYLNSIKDGNVYDLICLDIMMPRLDGIKVLKSIRDIEKQNGIETDKKVKIIMTTALNDKETVLKTYDSGCEAYACKPIEIDKFILVMRNLGLIKTPGRLCENL
ncbi:response regulator [Clostridium sp.]|uniref:response regulator n=1 Tax=Clostridium sp. TaxID=1506 RepID=UPI003D6D70CC